jgi:hypothetical protein
LATASLALVLFSTLLVICLVSHKSQPSCAVRTSATALTMVAFGVSLSASILATLYVKEAAKARYGVAVGLHYVSSPFIPASAVMLGFKTKSNGAVSAYHAPVETAMTSSA